MCGIVGVFNFRQGNSADRESLKKMADVMSYRGPDQEGYYVDSNVGLGHKRLSIIDLSEKGRQPMCNENQDLWITYNGEIYNFQELREELEKKGHRFKSNTDTEVIIHAYEEYGEKCLQKFNGMFAFAIYDSRKINGKSRKRLFLARDRLGQKPLFYYHDGQRFIFASELKAVIQDSDVKKEVSPEAVSNYLTFGYVPAPLSIFMGIKKLMPGHFLLLDSEGKMSIKQYWDISYKSAGKAEGYYTKKILDELEKAAKLRLVSDVPLGAFLSGGIDSSSVVAMMARHSDNVRTFTIGFEDQEFDESRYARLVAEKFNTEHKELIVRPKMTDMLPRLVWYYNEPYADSSALPSYYVTKMTRKHVTVALNGDGGDEAFGGYGKYAVDNFVDYYSRLPKLTKKTLGIASALRKTGLFRDSSIVKRLSDFSGMTMLSPKQRYVELVSHFNQASKKGIVSGKFTAKDVNGPLKLIDSYYSKKGLDQLHRKMYTDVKTFLPYDLLVKMDIATMANSLEGRSPYLDVNMVEFAASIPSNMKVRGITKKYILKKALKGILPKKILYKKKQGFSVPAENWFRNELKDIAHELLLGKKTMSRRYLKQPMVKKLLDEHSSGFKNHKTKIWNLLCLELWHRIYIERGGKEPKKGFDGIL